MSPPVGSIVSPYTLAPVATVPEALERMQQIQQFIEQHEPRRAHDGIAQFNHLYAVITAEVLDWIEAGRFADRRFLEELDVAFANRYLLALARSVDQMAAVPKPWRVMIRRRSDNRVAALQFAVAGVNAHINFDLPSAVVDACVKLGGPPDTGTRLADYLKVNQIFALKMEELRQSFQSEMIRIIDEHVLSQILNVVGNWSVEESRDLAWEHSKHLYRFRQNGLFRDPYLAVLNETTGFAGHLLLTPTLI
ncbi:MAG: DUF5995 family protein [Actinomycetota bacterium]